MILEKQKKIVEEFAKFKTWEEKYSHLIHLGKSCKIDPQYQTDKYRVKGCQSSVWMFAELKNGKIFYQADSDAAIVKGLVALVIRVFNEEDPKDIMTAPVDFLQELGLSTHLSQTRVSGLASVIKQTKLFAYALSFSASAN